MKRLLRIVFIFSAVFSLRELVARDWTQWRGPDRSNISAESGLLREWPTNGPPLLWKTLEIGEGIASVATSDGRLFTIGYRGESEFVFCLNAVTGESIWSSRIGPSIGENALMRWFTQRAPTVDGPQLYILGGAGRLVCLSTFDGRILWSKDYKVDFKSSTRPWGFTDWPLVDGERLLCAPMTSSVTLAALNKTTGEIIWTNHLNNDRMGYVPLVMTSLQNTRQCLAWVGNQLFSIDPATGKTIWSEKRPVRIGSTFTPMVKDNFIFTAAGYGAGMMLFEILQADGLLQSREIFNHRLMFDAFQDNALLIGSNVYAFRGLGTLACIDFQTGEVVWNAPTNRARTAVTAANGHLYTRDTDGRVSLIEVDPIDYKLKSLFQMPKPEAARGVTAPVVSHGRLYIRDNTRLFCYAISPATVKNAPAQPKIFTVPGGRGVPDTQAAYVPTPRDVIKEMLAMAQLKQGEHLYDLGSGDGRIVIEGATDFGARATGYEIDADLANQARQVLAGRGLTNARIINLDMFASSFTDANVVAVYLPQPVLARLVPQFEKLEQGARIISHQFAIPGFRPTAEKTIRSNEDGESHRILLYTIPLQRAEP